MKKAHPTVGQRDERHRKLLGWKIRIIAGDNKGSEMDPEGCLLGLEYSRMRGPSRLRRKLRSALLRHLARYPEDRDFMRLVRVYRPESRMRKALRELVEAVDNQQRLQSRSDKWIDPSPLILARKVLEDT